MKYSNYMLKNITLIICIHFLLSFNLLAQSETNDKGIYNVEVTEVGELTISTESDDVTKIEVYKNFPDMTLVETIDFTNMEEEKLKNLDKGIYVVAFKKSDGKAVAIKSVSIE